MSIWGFHWRSSQLFVVITCCVASFSDVFTCSILAPTLPFVLPDRAHVQAEDVQTWVAAIPSIIGASIVVSAPVAGWLSDRLSLRRRPFFMFGLLIQAGGIGLFMIGTSVAFYVSGAVFIGVSSAVVWTSSLAIMLDGVDHSQLGRYTGYLTSALGLAIFLGPLLGGILYEHAGSYAVWGICFAFVALDAILRLLMIETPRKSQAVIDKDEADSQRTTFGRPKALTLLKSPRVLTALWATIAVVTILASFDGSLTIHARDTFHWGSMGAGLLYLAFATSVVVNPTAGHFADKGWSKYMVTSGLLLGTIMLACLRFVDHNSTPQKVLLCALLFLTGFCLGPLEPILSAEVTQVVLTYEREHPGFFGESGAIAQAQGLWYAAFSLGATFGPLWGGLLQGAAGWKTVTWTLALLAAISAFPVLFFTNGPIHRRKENTEPVAEP